MFAFAMEWTKLSEGISTVPTEIQKKHGKVRTLYIANFATEFQFS